MISAKKTNSTVTKVVNIDNVGLGVMSRDRSHNLIFKAPDCGRKLGEIS